jgi:hypothetical protein
MATFTKLEATYDSVTSTGEPIAIAGTGTGSATTIHSIADGDEAVVTVTASNINSTDETFVLLIGGTADSDKINTIVAANSTRVVLNRQLLKASGAALVISAYSTTTNKVNVLVEVLTKETLNTTT